jgi:HipA-like protein
MRICEVYIHNIKAGTLTETDSGDYIFKYKLNYVNDKSHEPISLAMPLRKEEYRSNVLFPFFFNMLSEGENREIQSQILHIDKNDDFGILLETAQYDTIGSVIIKPIK